MERLRTWFNDWAALLGFGAFLIVLMSSLAQNNQLGAATALVLLIIPLCWWRSSER